MSDGTRPGLDHPKLPVVEQGVDYDARYSWRLEPREGLLCLTVAGRVTRAPMAPFADDAAEVLAASGANSLVVDFSACEHIASGALSYLVRFFKDATAKGAQVLGVGASDHVMGLMRVLGMDAFLFVVDDFAAAQRYFESQQD